MDPTDRARSLRATQTDAERKLWRHLRNGQVQGVKFRRQHPVGPYFADFCAPTLKLIIEVDGGQHTPERDAPRTRALQSAGYTVLRFWNNEVLENLAGVMEVIAGHVAAGAGTSPGIRNANSDLSPLARGEVNDLDQY